MNVTYCDDYEHMSLRAAERVVSAVEARSDALLCIAGGRSATGMCEELARKAESDRTLFAAVGVVKLDEWVGVPENHPVSSERYLRTHVLEPLGVAPERYLSLASDPEDPARECERVRSELARRGPIDVCVLGLGVNGHVGFNEPGPSLTPHCHVAELSQESRAHHSVRSLERKPRYGLTLGMREILASRKILLLVTGEGKEQPASRLLSGEVTTTLPASLLWLHHDADCLIDRTVLPDR